MSTHAPISCRSATGRLSLFNRLLEPSPVLPARLTTAAFDRVDATARRRRGAMTLIEVVVVLAVVTVLIALLLPAIARARAHARRAQCTSRLRQIGLALTQYHDAHRYFPPGGIQWRPFRSQRGEKQIAWSAMLLSYVEEQSLYNSVNFNLAFDSKGNSTAAAVVVDVFLCPSSRREGRTVDGRGACDYGGIFGERISSPNHPPKGTMIYDRPISIPMIRDGLSSTLIVSEDTHWGEGQWINGRNLFDVAYPINTAPPFENDIRSDHLRGANALLADGAVRFLNEKLDLRILAAISTRAGGEVAEGF